MKKVLICLMALMASIYSWGALTDPTRDGDLVTFSGSGVASTSTDWRTRNKSYIKTVIIEEGVTSIAADAFDGFSKLTSVKLPLSLVSIGDNAFNGTTVANLYYAGSPSDWASISLTDKDSHPFFGTSATRHFYFYGDETNYMTNLVLPPTITRVKQYAFYNGIFGSVYIPGTITDIEQRAFYCTINSGEHLVINKRGTAPNVVTGANASFMNQSRTLDYPIGATGYTTDKFGSNYTPTANAVNGETLGDKGAGVTWNLSEDGVLTLDATNGAKSLTVNLVDASMPWRYFRRLVYKVVIRGGVTELNNTLRYLYGISEIIIDQDNIPTADCISTSSTISTNSFQALFNLRDDVPLKVKHTALGNASVENLTAAPWNNTKIGNVTLIEPAIFSQSASNAAWLANAESYLDVTTFDLKLDRSMSNAYYNTFCSPIDMDASLVTSTFGAGTKIYSFAGTSYDEDLDELALNFNVSQNYITAGVPYLIWPANNVSNPSFTNVDLNDITTTAETVAGEHATFCGALAPVDVTSAQISAKSFIFLQANNTLNWASEGTLYGMRAYWLLTGDVPARALARRPIMKIGQSTTAIESVQTSDIRSEKIMRNGQIYIVRGEQMYNAQGQMIK